jgi:hypothetical protein
MAEFQYYSFNLNPGGNEPSGGFPETLKQATVATRKAIIAIPMNT